MSDCSKIDRLFKNRIWRILRTTQMILYILESRNFILFMNQNIFFFVLQQMQQDKKRADEERYKYELAEKEHEKTRKREEYLSSMGRTGKNSRGVINANYVYMLEEQKKRISQKDLRHQEKVLRDSCLVMGHVNDKFMA